MASSRGINTLQHFKYIQKRLNCVYTQAQLCWHKTAFTVRVYFAWQQVWATSRVVLAVQSTKLKGVNRHGTTWSAEKHIACCPLPPAPWSYWQVWKDSAEFLGVAEDFNLFHQSSWIYIRLTLSVENLRWIFFCPVLYKRRLTFYLFFFSLLHRESGYIYYFPK